jgi:two-component system sensor histidine kinase CpxA
MKVRFPLYAKILGWFFLNLIFIGAVFLVVARGQFHFGLDALISGPASQRMDEVARLMTDELADHPQAEWNEVLKSFNDAYKVQFFLFRGNDQLAGATVTLPEEVRNRMPLRRGMNPPFHLHPDNAPPPPERDGPPDQAHLPPPGQGPPAGRDVRKFMVHTSSPSEYWVLMRINVPGRDNPAQHGPIMLLAESDKISGGGLFFDLTSWIVGGIGVALISVLFWFPLVRGITRSISRMTRATEKIAEGNFDVRTQVRRQDELGSLSEAINRMAVRLAGFVAGQKRFLGDIAHELCSPIARIQVALGILEQRADEKQKVYLADLREEVEQMSSLVNELLSFSKASLGSITVKSQTVPLRELVARVVNRECGDSPQIKIEVPDDLRAMADPELLLRALGNILRNAVRHAGHAGPIQISATQTGATVKMMVEDEGPGVPAAALVQIFDPFYRVDASRDRETGGVGLGLSIVKTCVESCGGKVWCENREPRGLRVMVELPAG